MGEPAHALPDPYLVKPGDTLSGIARLSGKSISDLLRWNGMTDANRLSVGQSVYLSEASAFGVSTLFLDALRNPIENLIYRLVFDGGTVEGKTGPEGTVPRQVTASQHSEVQVLVQDLSGAWQKITSAASGIGHKLFTLVSDAVVVPGGTQALPTGTPAKPKAAATKPAPKNNAQPPLPKPAKGNSSKNNPALKHRRGKGPQGQPVIHIEVEIPQGLLDYFAGFTGKAITDEDWINASHKLECDEAVLKAFSEVESGGRNSFWRLNRGDGASIPAVLFERHYFSRLTGRRFDASHPDLSWRTGYRTKKELGTSDKKMSDGKVDADDIYGDYASAYLRLINAFRLDPEAALKSCSWGKFQIMGDNFKLCGSRDIDDFIRSMCTSEMSQIDLICGFIQNKPAAWKNVRKKSQGKEVTLWDAVKTKNWEAIAFNYNGPGYKTFEYDTKLKQAYEKHKA
jgi:LysM repeat protein